MSALLQDNTPRGFYKTLAGSFVIHIAAIAVGLVFFKAAPKKIFFTPVYTVNLVDPAELKPKRRRTGPARARVKTPARKTAAPVKKAPVKKAAKKSTRTVKTSGLSPAKPSAKVSVEESVVRIAKRVKEKESAEFLASSIEAIKGREEAREKELKAGIEEIKKRLAEAPSGDGDGGAGAAADGVGSGTAGAAVSRANLEVKYPGYLSTIRDKVQENWAYPETFRNKRLSIIVSIRIGRDGGLQDAWVELSSGLELFDQSLVTAIRKAAPFPPLPEGFKGEYFETGLRFCPECTD